jgi:hypothetical protein
MGIRKERGFPQQLEKSLAKDARLFHSSHRPNNKDLSTMYCRQRSTLRRLNFGPKDGEHLKILRGKRGSGTRKEKRGPTGTQKGDISNEVTKGTFLKSFDNA